MDLKYKPIIGLEIHVELSTKSKMFCQCEGNWFGAKPNTHVCPVCLGMPGALPVPNKQAVDWTILIGKALNCSINKISKFDRKHYFYPDLPKGYQISQYDEPIGVRGYLNIKYQISPLRPAPRDYAGQVNIKDTNKSSNIELADQNKETQKQFGITRVHLEEDTGKLIHSGNETLIDFNRSGVPLVEIVTEPDFDNAKDVSRFLEELQVVIRYLGVSDADMEKGSMRLEPNISLRKIGDDENKLPNYKIEIKNINSFRFVSRAIEYEIKRQSELLEKGETPKQETRGFDEKKNITYSQRSKEEAHDYRYFPEPDIPPMRFSQDYLGQIFSKLPELPQEKLERFVRDFNIRSDDAYQLTRNREIADYFEAINSKIKDGANYGQDSKSDKNLSQQIANFIIHKKISTKLTVDEFIKKAEVILKPVETDVGTLDKAIKSAIAGNSRVVDDYKSGKTNAIMFLVGVVMREMKGHADAKIVISKIREQIIK